MVPNNAFIPIWATAAPCIGVPGRRCPMDHSHEEFQVAVKQKEKLFELLEGLETREKIRKKRRPEPKRKYDRTVTGYGKIVEIKDATICWRRPDGEIIGPIVMTNEICDLLRVGNDLMMSVGQRGEEWRVLFVG